MEKKQGFVHGRDRVAVLSVGRNGSRFEACLHVCHGIRAPLIYYQFGPVRY